MSRQITIHYEGNPLYNIRLEDNYHALEEMLEEIGISGHRIGIVSDSHVAPHYLAEIQEIAQKVAAEVISFIFPAGEQSKNLDTVADLYEKLIQAHFDRKDILLALGGGVVGDLTGYAASTYLRGIRVIQLPTSLLAMVDSSIGGKTGVDFRGYKNMIGAFHQPSAVYMNLSALFTLTDREYYSGFGEIIKHGLIRDLSYYDYLQKHRDVAARHDKDREELMLLKEIVAGSCQIKREVVENDPKEKGERALLNFGHTLGHAIEKLMDFSLLHGECVSLGMVAACALSKNRGWITQKEYEGIREILQALQLPVELKGLDARQIIEVSKSDKKMDAGQIRFVLLKKLGEAVITTDVSEREMEEALQEVLV